MYPNIILSNRLQPVAIVNEKVCAGCDYNKPENDCKRNLNWQWKGSYFPLSEREYEMLKHNLRMEQGEDHNNGQLKFGEVETFNEKLKLRVK